MTTTSLPAVHPQPGLTFGGGLKAAVQAVSAVLSLEGACVMTIYSGLFKGNPLIPRIPVDATLLFGALTALCVVAVVFRRGLRILRRPFTAALLAFVVFAFTGLSLSWTTELQAGTQKTLIASSIPLLCFLTVALLIAPSRERVERFLWLTLLCSFWVGVLTALLMLTTGFAGSASGGLEIEGASDYIIRGNSLALGIIVLMGWLMFSHRGASRLLLFGGMILALLVGILVTGSKQSLVGLALVVGGSYGGYLGACAAAGRFPTLRRMFLPIAIVVGGSLLVPRMLASGVNLSTITRFAEFFSSTQDEVMEEYSRVQYARVVLDRFGEAPLLGHGAGVFGVRHGISPKDHPHNIVLDYLYDTGALGLALFLLLVGYCLYGFPWREIYRDRLVFTALFTLVFAAFTAMVTESYSEARVFMAFLALVSGASQFVRSGATPLGPARLARALRERAPAARAQGQAVRLETPL